MGKSFATGVKIILCLKHQSAVLPAARDILIMQPMRKLFFDCDRAGSAFRLWNPETRKNDLIHV